MRGEPILITGGDGFIGKNIVKRLLANNISVIIIDNNLTSYEIDYNNRFVLKFKEDISFININLIPKVSGIIHLASVASPLVYKDNPEQVLNPNTLGSRKVIEIAKRDNVKILYASTSEVYGEINPEFFPNGIKENDISSGHLLTTRSCYRIAKMFGEELFKNYFDQKGDVNIIRLFNVYGKEMDLKNIGYGRVIPNFFNRLSRNKEVVIYGTGEQVRSFLWIDEAVDIILELFFSKKRVAGAINIGNPSPTTILELAQKISILLKKDLNISFKSIDIDDPLWRKPNIDKVFKLFSWFPKVSIDDGLYKIYHEEILDLRGVNEKKRINY